MRVSLLIVCICGHLWLAGAAVIPTSVTSVLTNEKKPVAAQLFREHSKSNKNNINSNNDKKQPAKRKFGFPNYQVEDGMFSWYSGAYSYDYIPGETTGLLISQKALSNNIIELLGLQNSIVKLPGGKGVLPLQTKSAWKYRNGQISSASNIYALYLPVNYLQQQGVSTNQLGEFVAACGDEFAYALGTPDDLEESNGPLLLGWAEYDDTIVGRIAQMDKKVRQKVKRSSILTFGGANIGDTISLFDSEAAGEQEPPAIETTPFTSGKLLNGKSSVSNSTTSSFVTAKKYPQVVVAPFTFD